MLHGAASARRVGRRFARGLVTPFARRALILCYHRIADAGTDPWGLAVSPRHLDEQLAVLRHRYTVVPLDRLVDALEDGSLPRRAIAVTFDDGYADNLHLARPLFERHSVPATVFVTANAIGQGHEFWWEELDRLLLQPGTLPDAIELGVDTWRHRWTLGDAARLGEDAARRDRGWRAWQEPPTARHRLFRALWELLLPLAEVERDRALAALRAWAGVDLSGRPTHLPMSRAEVIDLARMGFFTVGAHTLSHPMLSALPPEAQRTEIGHSKAMLEEILGRPVTSMAYPYGKRAHYTAETVAIAREAGYLAACAFVSGPVRPASDRLQLPRVQVPDAGGRAFGRWLAKWLSA